MAQAGEFHHRTGVIRVESEDPITPVGIPLARAATIAAVAEISPRRTDHVPSTESQPAAECRALATPRAMSMHQA